MARATTAAAQEPEASDEEAAARTQANNPLADITAFNIQNYWVPKLYGIDDEPANTFWARLAVPTGPVLWRLSIPLPTVPTPSGAPEAGLGDMQLFAAYLAVQKPTFNFGIGPQLVFPDGSTSNVTQLKGGAPTLHVSALVFDGKEDRWESARSDSTDLAKEIQRKINEVSG